MQRPKKGIIPINPEKDKKIKDRLGRVIGTIVWRAGITRPTGVEDGWEALIKPESIIPMHKPAPVVGFGETPEAALQSAIISMRMIGRLGEVLDDTVWEDEEEEE